MSISKSEGGLNGPGLIFKHIYKSRRNQKLLPLLNDPVVFTAKIVLSSVV